MKERIFSLVFALSLFTSPFAMAQKVATDFTLPTDNGSLVLSEQHGKVVYLDFWASWCPPCRASFPWMNELQEKYGKRGLKVIAVNLDKERDSANEFLTETPSRVTIAYDPEGTIAESYGVMGMPSSYLIDRNGNLHSSHIGFRDKDKAELEEKIVQLLESK